jgi:hypothetical protein
MKDMFKVAGVILVDAWQMVVHGVKRSWAFVLGGGAAVAALFGAPQSASAQTYTPPAMEFPSIIDFSGTVDAWLTAYGPIIATVAGFSIALAIVWSVIRHFKHT